MGDFLSGCNPPARLKITLVKVIKLTFKTDHATKAPAVAMKDNNSDWGNSGSPFSKPEWTYGNKSKPVSHTKNSAVTVEVVFDVYPRNAGTTACTVKGKSAFGALEFSVAGNIQGGGAQTFTATSSNNLPDKVTKLTGDITWTVETTEDGPFDAGASWGHTVYVTLDTPVSIVGKSEEGITEKRMDVAVREVEKVASNDPHKIIEKLVNIFQSYTLTDSMPPPGVSPVPVGSWTYGHCKYFGPMGAWPIIDYVGDAGQCQAIVRFVRAAAKQVGCPGEIKIMLVYATPLVNDGKTVIEDEFEAVRGERGMGGLNGNPNDPDPAKQGHPKKVVNGKEWQAALFDRSPRAVGTLFEAGGDDNGKPPYMGPNNYEACLKFTANGITRYYGGGMPGLSFDTKELVLSAAFPALVWVSLPPAPPGRTFLKVEQIIKAAPW